jgi:hypothetical protein
MLKKFASVVCVGLLTLGFVGCGAPATDTAADATPAAEATPDEAAAPAEGESEAAAPAEGESH